MGEEASYLEDLYIDEMVNEEMAEERHSDYIEDLMDGKINVNRKNAIKDSDLLEIAEYRLETGKYNKDFYKTAIKIISDGNLMTERQRRCLYGFIRLKEDKQKKRK